MILNETKTPAANIASDAARHLTNSDMSSVPPSPKIPSASMYISRQNIYTYMAMVMTRSTRMYRTTASACCTTPVLILPARWYITIW